MKDRTFEEIYQSHTGRPSMKWDHYFKIYDTHFQSFRGTSPRVLEIGVRKGGSLEIWRDYFGLGCKIVGVDINPECCEMEVDGFEIYIGDQGSPAFLTDLAERSGPFDIIVDDGSHRMDDLRTSFSTLFPLLNSGGLYLVEDTHTCYMEEYGGGFQNPGSFIENAKAIIDQMHAFYSEDRSNFGPNGLTVTVNATHFYDSIVVIEKINRFDPVTGAVVKREGRRSGGAVAPRSS